MVTTQKEKGLRKDIFQRMFASFFFRWGTFNKIVYIAFDPFKNIYLCRPKIIRTERYFLFVGIELSPLQVVPKGEKITTI
jgi:hypothetical protein